MQKQSHFKYSLTSSIIFVTVSNTAFAILGFLFYGEQTQSIILLNLNNSVWVDCVRICLCVDLLFTYPVVFAAGREIVERTFLNPKSEYLTLQSNFVRVILVGATFGMAQISAFGTATNLVGGFAMSSLGLILPPLMTLKFYRTSMNVFSIGVNIIIILFGCAAVGFTTFLSIKQIIQGDSQ